MRRLRAGIAGTAAVLALAAAFAFTSYAKDDDEREKVGHITLNFDVDVQAGESDGTVDVSVEDGECSVGSVDFVNEQEYWLGGDKPKVEIWLEADSDYYFPKSSKSAFTFKGDKVKFLSASRKNDKEEMVLTVRLDKLDEDDEDLDVGNLGWDENNGIAHWDELGIAKNYKVRLCRTNSSASDDGFGPTYTVRETSFDFSGKFPRAGSYYFKVRAFDAAGNAGDWQDSPYIEVTDEDLQSWKGSWVKNERGWWYSNRDGSYPQNEWQYIDASWYFFDGEGYMKTGWIDWEGKSYYCDPSGAMLSSTTTPDGFQVGDDGARL